MNSIEITTVDVYVISALVLFWVVAWRLTTRVSELTADVIRVVAYLLVPFLILLWITDQIIEIDDESQLTKIEHTAISFVGLWAVALGIKALYLRNATENSFRGRTPRVLIGIFSFCFVVAGGLFAFAGIWKKDLSPLLTTFGVGSLVLGLALQDTLGNLFAGLALVFDRPFSVGHWIQVGDVIGRVKQIEWRGVRVVTRELNEITIPNIVIGKEQIVNFSSPSPIYGMRIKLGFSYDAPPNKVRQMLAEVALNTPGILTNPYPDVRTLNYGDFSVEYEVFFFIGDYDPVNRIRNEFMTNVWYAAKRYGITIPYPTSVQYQTHLEPRAIDEKRDHKVFDLIRAADLFKSLTDEECQQLAADSRIDYYARGQFLFKEGDEGNHLYVFIEGEVAVQVKGEGGEAVTIAVLSRGDVIGEMALFTGEPRKASGVALTDIVAVRIDKPVIAHLLESREDLINAFVSSMTSRSKLADEMRAQHRAELAASQVPTKIDENALRQRIRRFFGL